MPIAPPETSHNLEKGGTQVNFPIRVAIVDDAKAFRAVLRSALEKQRGLDVVAEAENGQEALEVVGRHQPDVLVMDLAMPVMNGLEATRAVVVKHPKTRILILTMNASEEAYQEALSAGAHGFLPKSCRLRKLYRTILNCAFARV
jgi:DNA-binding NarL/FixJ family response regulator